MHILHVYKTYFPDTLMGIERVIFEIAEGGAARGSTHEVLCLSPSPRPQALAVGLHRVHRARQDLMVASNGMSVSAIGLYRQLWREADAIHFHYPWPMMDVLHLLEPHRNGKPVVVTYHSDVVRQRLLGSLYAPLRNWFLGSADVIVATSTNYVQSSPVLRRRTDKVRVVPIGLGERPASDSATIAAMRARVGEGFFLFLGAARYYKGLPFLIEAARASGLPVVLAGSFAPDEIGPLPVNVTAIGKVSEPEKEALLELCLALVLPSHLRSEAYGVVLVEAARAGRPMISCEIGTGTSFVNAHGETGLVVPPGDPLGLAEAMRRLATDQDFAQTSGMRARARYDRLFTAAQMADAYDGIYRDLLASRASRNHYVEVSSGVRRDG